jgi:hypothetical protein
MYSTHSKILQGTHQLARIRLRVQRMNQEWFPTNVRVHFRTVATWKTCSLKATLDIETLELAMLIARMRGDIMYCGCRRICICCTSFRSMTRVGATYHFLFLIAIVTERVRIETVCMLVRSSLCKYFRNKSAAFLSMRSNLSFSLCVCLSFSLFPST